ncbi:hypothetical protein D3C78_1309690 [compost metagenome]
MSLSEQTMKQLGDAIQRGLKERPECFMAFATTSHVMPGIRAEQVGNTITIEQGSTNTLIATINIIRTGQELKGLGIVGFHTNYHYNHKTGAVENTAEATMDQCINVLDYLYLYGVCSHGRELVG